MKPLLILFLVLLFSTHAWSQQQQADSLLSRIQHYDSTALKPQQKIDSIQATFYQQTDSLQQACSGRLLKLESLNSIFQRKADSLKSSNQPIERYTHKLDSINELRQQTLAKAEQKLQSLKANTTGKLKSLDLPLELQSKLSEATKGIGSFNLSVKDLNIASLKIPGTSLDQISNTNLQSPIGKLPDIGKLPGGSELKDVQGSMKEISTITGQAGKYEKDVKNIANRNIKDVKELPKTIENKVGELSGVNDLKGQTKALDQYTDKVKQLQDPAKQKEQLTEKAKEVAVDHFAGKEQVLQQAMDKVSKYKEKYPSLQSIGDATRRRPNEMRGKPLQERLVPGIALQLQRKAMMC